VHPADLSQFPESFRVMLALGRVLALGTAGTGAGAGSVPPPEAGTLASEELAALRAERDGLEQRLAEKARQLAQLESVRADLEALTQERDRLLLSAADTSAIDALRREHAAAVSRLQAEIAELSAERDRACAERDALERQLAERAQMEQAALAQAQAQREALVLAMEEMRREQQTVEAAAGTVLSRVEGLRARAVEAQREVHATLDRIEAMPASRGVALEEVERLEAALAEARSALALLEARRREEELAAEGLHAALRADLEGARQEAAMRAEALQQAEAALAEERRGHKELAFELNKARRQVALATVELDALRHEAAAQVAHAQLALGEREARLGEVSDALELARHAGRTAALEARTLQKEIHRMADALDALSARLGIFDALLPATAGGAPEEPRRAEPILFDASVIRSAAETLHALTREIAQDSLHSGEDGRDAAAGGT
jgi:chromosome segregation ATPase